MPRCWVSAPRAWFWANDLIGQVLRCVRGIDVTEDDISLETMRSVCMGGPGHYLGTDQTLSRMQTDYVYPAVADRMSPKEWEEREKPDLILRARARMARILEMPSSAAFAPDLDAALRARFRIHLKTG